MSTNRLHARLLHWVLAPVCAGLVLAGCGNHGSVADAARYQAAGEYRSAYIEAKKVLQRQSTNAKAWLALGNAKLMMGKPRNALKDFEKARAYGAPAAAWAVPMGRAWLVTRQYDKVLTKLPDGKTFKPQTRTALDVVRGDAYRGSNQASPAAKAYKAALTLDPHNARALAGLVALAVAGDDMAVAHKYVQQALKVAATSPDVWVAKGDLALANDDFAGAASAYEKALALKMHRWLPQDRFVTQLKLANAQMRQGRFEKALANIEALEKMSPQMPRPRYLHAMVLFKQGHPDKAITQLQQVLRLDPHNVPAQFLMGRVNYASGNYGQAQMYLSNVLGMEPGNARARKLLALSFYREGSSSRALATLKPALPGNMSDTRMLAMMQQAVAAGAATSHPRRIAAAGNSAAGQFADVHKALAAGRAGKAIELLKAMPEQKGAAATRRAGLLVMAYVRNKQADTAVETAATWAKAHPKIGSAHLLYGTALVAADKHRQARAEYEQAAKLDPESGVALLKLGNLDVLEHRYKDAKNRFAAALENAPHNGAAMLELGKLAMVQGDQADAIKWFKQTIAAQPKATEAYLRLITIYARRGRFDQGVATARRLVDTHPGAPLALNALGATELDAGHPDQALKPLEQAVRRAPNISLYRVNLARAQILLKDAKSARTNLERVVKVNPQQVKAVSMLAFVYLHAGDLPGALELARTLQQREANRVRGYTLEGDLYMAAKDFRKAADAYQNGLEVNYSRPLVLKYFLALNAGGAPKADQGPIQWLGKHEKDTAMRMVLAQYHLHHGRLKLAEREYQTVLTAYPTNVIALNNLAWLYVVRHHPDAVAVAKKAYTLTPTSPNVADTYAWALLRANQPKAALPILEKAARQVPTDPIVHYHLALAQTRSGKPAAAHATLAVLTKSKARYPQRKAAEALYRQLGGAGANGEGTQ
ncbi:MAG TPA: XrtA/PEP-CTERM system TPR-repeat protein PrsT [Oleiagrimonas sp.]|nr:XrtA/PEP-CTERM system TPR-repeat protein PrsT [Oleiagrimonas sp.]